MNEMFAHVHKLWLFSLLAEHRSFKRAAAQAGLTQSALSQHLSRLEAVVGCILIVRSRAALALTEEGERLLAEVLPILHQLETLGPLDSSRAKEKRVPLRVGAYESVVLTYLVGPLRNLMAARRDVEVRIRVGRSAVLKAMVKEGELDMAIVDSEGSAPLVSVPVATSHLGLYHSAKYSVEQVREAETLSLGSLSFGRGSYPEYFMQFQEFNDRHLRERSIRLRTTVVSDSFETLKSMALEGGLLTVLPHHVAKRTRGGLIELQLGDRPAAYTGEHTFYLVSRQRANAPFRDALYAALIAGAPREASMRP